MDLPYHDALEQRGAVGLGDVIVCLGKATFSRAKGIVANRLIPVTTD